MEEFIKGDLTTLNSKDTDPHEQIVASPYNQDYEIPRNKLLIGKNFVQIKFLPQVTYA